VGADAGCCRPLYKSGNRRPPRHLEEPSAVAHGGRLPWAHNQQVIVSGRPTAVGHNGWTYCRHGPWWLALSDVGHDGGGIVLINFKTIV
jgi:hypothetical protein